MQEPDTALTHPYPGLRAFRTKESAIFCGRSEHRLDLLQKLESNRFLAVIGASGSGKSSLVKAGLLADIQAGLLLPVPPRRCRIIDFRPGLNPFRSMATGLSETFELPPTEAERLLRSGNRGLVKVMDAVTGKYAGSGQDEHEEAEAEAPILVAYVDQFEELLRFAGLEAHETETEEFQNERAGFPLLDGALNEAQAFVSMILRSAREKAYRIYVVLSMRSDFLKDVDVYEQLPEAISDSQFLTPLLNRSQMEEAIERPLKRFHSKADERLVPLILNQASPEEDQLPVLQHALARTWDYASSRWEKKPEAERILTVADYNQAGGVAKALEQHADEILANLVAERGRKPAPAEMEERITVDEADVEHFFTCLAEFDSEKRLTRRPRTVAQVAAESELHENQVIAIADAYRAPGCHLIMPPVKDCPELRADDVLDISHESLLRKWPRLAEWMKEEDDRAFVFKQLKGTISEHEWTVPESRWDSLRRAAMSFFGGPPIAGWQRRRADRALLKDKQFPFNQAWAQRHDGHCKSVTSLIRQAKFEYLVRVWSTALAALLVAVTVFLLYNARQAAKKEALAQKLQNEVNEAKLQKAERDLARERERFAKEQAISGAGSAQQNQEQWQALIRKIGEIDEDVLARKEIKDLAAGLGMDLSGFKADPPQVVVRKDVQAPRIEPFELPAAGAAELHFVKLAKTSEQDPQTGNDPGPNLVMKTPRSAAAWSQLFHYDRADKSLVQSLDAVSRLLVAPSGEEIVAVSPGGIRFVVIDGPVAGLKSTSGTVGHPIDVFSGEKPAGQSAVDKIYTDGGGIVTFDNSQLKARTGSILEVKRKETPIALLLVTSLRESRGAARIIMGSTGTELSPRQGDGLMVVRRAGFIGAEFLDDTNLLLVYDRGFGVVDKASGKTLSFTEIEMPKGSTGSPETMVWVSAQNLLVTAPAGFGASPVFEVHVQGSKPVGYLTFRMSTAVQRLFVSPTMTSAVATVAAKGEVEKANVWNFRNLQEAMKLSKGAARPVYMERPFPAENWMGYSPDGASFVLSDREGILRAWTKEHLRMQEGGNLRPPTLELIGHRSMVSAAAWGTRQEDGRTEVFCVTGDENGSLLLWKLSGAAEEAATSSVRSVHRAHLVEMRKDGPEPRRDIRPIVLPVHKGAVTAIAISRDGRTLASAGGDGGKIFPIQSSFVGRYRIYDKRGIAGTLAILDESDYSDSRFEDLFHDQQLERPQGQATYRMLNPEGAFLAARWDYALTPKSFLRNHKVRVFKLDKDGERIGGGKLAQPVDWGPLEGSAEEVVELSPGLREQLGLGEHDNVEVLIDLLSTPTARPRSRYRTQD